MTVRLPRTTSLVLAIFFGAAFLAPLPFVVLMPGNAQNVLDQSAEVKTITLSKSAPASLQIYPSDGNLYLLSILITNPSAYVTGVELLYSWMKSEYAVMPRSLFYKNGRSAEAEKAIAKSEMVDSQVVANRWRWNISKRITRNLQQLLSNQVIWKFHSLRPAVQVAGSPLQSE